MHHRLRDLATRGLAKLQTSSERPDPARRLWRAHLERLASSPVYETLLLALIDLGLGHRVDVHQLILRMITRLRRNPPDSPTPTAGPTEPPTTEEPAPAPQGRGLRHARYGQLRKGNAMTRETLQHLNTNTLIGMTSQRGTAWHYRAEEQGEETNHYPGPIPVEDVERRLFHWTAQSRRIAVETQPTSRG